MDPEPSPRNNDLVPQISERERQAREKKRAKEEAALYRPRRSLGKKIWQGLWWLVIVGAIVFHAAGGWVYGGRITEGAFEVPSDISFATVDSDLASAGLDVEKVTYQSELGAMDAWRTFGAKDTWVIHVHGKGGSPASFATAMKALADAGYPQLAIAYRNDPGAPADPSGIYQHGVTEWRDLQKAVEYAVAEGADHVVLSGQSMGGAIILAYVYREPTGLVTGLVLDAPSLDLTSNIGLAAEAERLPGNLPVPATLTFTASFVASVQTGANLDLMNYLKRDGQLVVPTLVFHGTDDETVPIETSRQLASDRPGTVTLVEIPGANHVEAMTVDPERYTSTLVAFVNTNAG